MEKSNLLEEIENIQKKSGDSLDNVLNLISNINEKEVTSQEFIEFERKSDHAKYNEKGYITKLY